MRFEKAPTVFTPLDDGRGVLLNLETLFYYSLNRSGAALWQEMENSQTLDDLVSITCERFEVDQDTARREIGDFVERLQEFKVLRVI
jgi:hypothetical protein